MSDDNDAVNLSPDNHIDWEAFKHSRYATDTQGHSMRMSFRIQPQVGRVMSELIREFDSYYKEPGDLIRHAIREHIKRLQTYREFKDDDRIATTMKQVDAILDILQMEEEQANFEQVMSRTEQVIQNLQGKGAMGETARLLRDLRVHVKQMRSDFWRERYLEMMEQKFSHLEKMMPGLSLLETEDD